MPSMSKLRRIKADMSTIFSTVESNPMLLDLLEIATSDARKIIFIKKLIAILPTAFSSLNECAVLSKFDIFTIQFGSYNQSTTIFSRVAAAIYRRKHYFLETRYKKREFISDIGLDWTPDTKSSFFSKVKYACLCSQEILISFLLD